MAEQLRATQLKGASRQVARAREAMAAQLTDAPNEPPNPTPTPPEDCPPPWISPRPPECDGDYEPPDPGPGPGPGPDPDPPPPENCPPPYISPRPPGCDGDPEPPDPGPGPGPEPGPGPGPDPEPPLTPPQQPAPDYGPFGAGSPYAGQDPFSNPANLPYYWTPDLGYSHLYAPPWGSGYGVPTQQYPGYYAPNTYGNYYINQGNWGDPWQPPQLRTADPLSPAMTPYPANTYGATYGGTGYSSYGYPSYGYPSYGYPSYGYGYY